jgi:hypothetical protein
MRRSIALLASLTFRPSRYAALAFDCNVPGQEPSIPLAIHHARYFEESVHHGARFHADDISRAHAPVAQQNAIRPGGNSLNIALAASA